MVDSFSDPPVNKAILQEMRRLAESGTTVRELTQLIQSRLGITQANGVVAILSYFSRAFGIPLQFILPIREWLDTNQDAEIDAEILPIIEQYKDQWTPKIEKMEPLLS